MASLLGNIIRWLWDFGDGTTSTLENPEHEYLYMPGTYTVRLTVWDEFGYSHTYTYEDFIRIYDYDYDGENPNASITDKCYRLPVMLKHGYGPSEYTDSDNPGFDWIWPPTQTGVCKIYDAQKNEVALAVDTKTQEIYWMNRPDSFWDRQAGGYSANRRLIGEVHEKAIHAVDGEQVAIRIVEGHVYIKPENRGRRNTDGFDDQGFMNGMRVDILAMRNEEPVTELMRTNNIPIDGDIVYQDQIEARSWQQRKRFYGSAWWYTGWRTLYTTIDKAQRPDLRLMSEYNYLDRLRGNPLFHLTRNINPLLNMATGQLATGTADSTSTGPDGLSGSALRTVVNFGVSDTSPENVNGDYTAMMWLRTAAGTTFPITMWTIGTMTVQMVQTGTQLSILITDGGLTLLNQNIDGDVESWRLITLVRSGSSILLYNNLTLVTTDALASIVDHGTAIAVATNTPLSVFDACLVPVAVTEEEIQFYYNDIMRNGGNVVLPPF